MQILLHIFDKDPILLEINRDDKIGQIRSSIAGVCDNTIDLSNCRIAYNGLTMDEEQTFAYYDIQDNDTIIIESTKNKFNFKSFSAPTFEELDAKIQSWLRLVNKRLATISCYYDSSANMHRAMIATNPTEVVIVGRPSGGYHYSHETYKTANVTEDGRLLVRII